MREGLLAGTSRNRTLLVGALVCLSLTAAGCTNTSRPTDEYVIEAYPYKTIFSELKDSTSPPPTRTSSATAPSSTSTAAATRPSPTTSSASTPTAAVPPAGSAASQDADAVAASYPSVSIFDFAKSASH
jgi:hypothetical protein